MSRIGKKPIEIPKGVEVIFENNILIVSGKNGKLQLDLAPLSNIEIKDNVITVSAPEGEKANEGKYRALFGLTRALINNMVVGVSEGFLKELSVIGTGYKAELKGNELIVKVGFSHDLKFIVPEGLLVRVAEGVSIKISGADKQQVGELAARIYLSKKTNPYSGKGIRYKDKPVRRKERKAGV